MNYRNKTTAAVSTQGELRRANANTSFPKVWDAAVCTLLNIDPVLAAPQPSHTALQRVNSIAPVQDANNNWVEGWEVVDIFADTTVDGVTTTKSAHESAHTASLVAVVARATRDALLTATDFYALSDVTMSSAMATYRTALRNVPAQSEFPATISWPTAP